MKKGKKLMAFALPRPRRPIVDKMCSSCPFRTDGGAPKISVPAHEMEQFRFVAENSEFYCHETVLEDPRTKKNSKGDADPAEGIQPHFEVCRGGWELRLAAHKKRTG